MKSRCALILCFSIVLTSSLVLGPTKALATTLPSGFSEVAVTSGLSAPTGFDFAPDGRIFICEQVVTSTTGRVRVIAANGNLNPTPFVTIQASTNSERGVLGVALDPNFASNNFVYVYYTTNSNSLNAPASPKNRVSRFTANGDVVVPGSELILLDLIPSDAGNHNGGCIKFGVDGTLYISAGDGGANSNNSQNRANLAGKILRINKDGSIPSDNPYFGNSQGFRQEIWCYGLRNPWRFNFQPNTNALFIGDVGQNTWEEIDIGTPGGNFGWPTAEGNSSNPAFTNPIFTYNHNASGASITGGDFYEGTTFPAEYSGTYFYGDYVDGYIRRLTLDANNVVIADDPFATNVQGPVDIEYHNNDLYYSAVNIGALMRITYSAGGNRAPLAVASATPVAGASPLTVNFSSAGSNDPDNDTLTFDWDFGDGSPHSNLPNPSHSYSGSTNRQATLTVRDPNNASDTSPAILITPGNNAPIPLITAPAPSAPYNAGDTINYSGTVTDSEQSPFPASGYSWKVVFHHDDHTHPFLGPIVGATNGSFVIPTTGEQAADVFYEIILTATDARGAKVSTSTTIVPRTVQLSFNTLPAGLNVTLDGQPTLTPFSVTGVVGFQRQIGVPLPQSSGGSTYTVFSGWSDGGAQNHAIVTPSSSTTYTAVLVANSAPTKVPLAGDWNSDGTHTVGIYFNQTAVFALRNTQAPGPADVTSSFGPTNPGWIGVVGDWDGNGSYTHAVFDPATSTFFIRNSNTPGGANVVVSFGPAGSGWTPIAGDWDGNGTTTVGLYDPATGAFFLRNSNTPGPANIIVSFGAGGPSVVPIVGDWNNDGTDTIGIYNNATSVFFLRDSNTPGGAHHTFQFGGAGAGFAPIAGNWDNAGGWSVGLYDRLNGVFFLTNSLAPGPAAFTFSFGPPGN
jgi:glucose/arabinose dehydrogenase